MVEAINQTRSAKETDAINSNATPEGNQLTSDDMQNILSVTQNDPTFDAIVNDLINNYILNADEGEAPPPETHTPEVKACCSKDIPLKERLRPRSEKKKTGSERKKKVNIISIEPYTGVVPAIANLLSNRTAPIEAIPPTVLSLPTAPIESIPPVVLNLPLYVQSDMLQTLQAVSTLSIPSEVVASLPVESLVASTSSAVVYQNVLQSDLSQFPEQPTTTTDDEKSKLQVEKKESTPKMVLYPSFLETKCKSTPRRGAKHVRTLDFDQTPSSRRLSTIKQFQTPTSNGIPTTTPGSAPANISLCKSSTRPVAEGVAKVVTPDSVIDENSNSNSISDTPKVAKNRQGRKFASKLAEKPKVAAPTIDEELAKPFGVEDWKNMRSQNKNLPIDYRLRLINQKAENRVNLRKRKTPKKGSGKKKKIPVKAAKKNKPKKLLDEQKENQTANEVKAESSTSTEFDENKPLIKFKITSPRKAMVQKKPPKKKAKAIVECSKEKNEAQDEEKKEEVVKEVEPAPVETAEKESEEPSELNRSDTVQEVATMLTHLSETILAKGNKADDAPEAESDAKEQVDSGIEPNALLETPFKDIADMLETPFKHNSLTPLPNTPRFAIPLISSSHETPMPKIFASTTGSMASLVKVCDILTPSFPITPGFKETPPKDGIEVSPATASGYSSRRTDYSSCSSYYKPDESEDVKDINALLSRRGSERNSQSESDGGQPVKVIGSTKKVECPGAIERVKSFTEEQVEHPKPHYNMMDEGLLSESIVTTATDDSSSSQFTCSTCSTDDSSDDENLIDKLNSSSDEKDAEWQYDANDVKQSQPCSSVMNEKTGEVRFPLRNWITPKKPEMSAEQARIEETNKIKSMLVESDQRRCLSIQEEKAIIKREMDAKLQRTINAIKKNSGSSTMPAQQKFKKSNQKAFKLPAEGAQKPNFMTKRDQIIQKVLHTERSRPTPLKLLPSSSSRRKSATPRKTIVIEQLPRQASPIKKKKVQKREAMPAKSLAKVDRLSLESDNAIMPEDTPSLNSTYSTSFEDESVSTVVANHSPAKPPPLSEEGSNTFQRTMIAQGFDKTAAKELQTELIDKLEPIIEAPQEQVEKKLEENLSDESDSDDEDSEPELVISTAEDNEKNVFHFTEPKNFQPRVPSITQFEIPMMILRFGDREAKLTDSGLIHLFEMKPSVGEKSNSNSSKKFSDEKKPKTNGKDSPSKNGKSKATKKSDIRWDQSNAGVKDPEK